MSGVLKKYFKIIKKFLIKFFVVIKQYFIKMWLICRKKFPKLFNIIKMYGKNFFKRVKTYYQKIIINIKVFLQKHKFGKEIIIFLQKTWHHFQDVIWKNKKTIWLMVFAGGYILFWMWFFGDRNVGVQQVNGTQSNKTEVQQTQIKNKENKNENKREFTEKDLGTFWLEVQTDKVKIKAPIVNGIKDSDLDRGLGRHKTMAMPGEKGNLVISGHRWKFGNNPARTAFIDLDKLKKGDRVKIHYNKHIFEYEIVESGVVKPNDKGVKEILKKTDEPILTLYTCTPKYTSLKRLYYRAKLIK